MAYLPQPKPNIKQLFLPSTKDVADDQKRWVKFDIRPMTVGDRLLFESLTSETERQVRFLTTRIVEWNLADENSTIRPINRDSMLLLDNMDYMFLTLQPLSEAAVQPLSEDEKKN